VEAYPRTLDTQLTSHSSRNPSPSYKGYHQRTSISANQALLTAQNQKPSSAPLHGKAPIKTFIAAKPKHIYYVQKDDKAIKNLKSHRVSPMCMKKITVSDKVYKKLSALKGEKTFTEIIDELIRENVPK
jgi:hypothetical protein